jgi:glyoxylase I family protein
MAGTNQAIGGGGFHHVAIRARDFDRSVAFYRDVFGFTEKVNWGEQPKRAVMMDTGDGNYLEIFERPTQQWSDSDACILHMALRTSDCDAALERARAAGCDVTVEPKDVIMDAKQGKVPVRIAFFKGPDGEIIELLQNELT